MQGASAAHRRMRAVVAALVLIAVSTPAAAIEFWDGKLEVHGYYEQQIRSLWEDYTGSNDWDLTQWYHVLNLEIEADIAPDGVGPFDLVSAFARIEARYDCVWRRGCGLFRSADVYGDRPGRLPQRLASGHETGYSSTQFTGDTRRQFDFDITRWNFLDRHDPDLAGSRVAVGPHGSITYNGFWGASAGLDGVIDPTVNPDSDDPAQLLMENLEECLFTSRAVRGSTHGFGTQELIHNIKCGIHPIRDTRQVPNPFRAQDPNERVLGGGGGGALPFRPAPEVRFDAGAPDHVASGIWIPNERLAKMLRDGEFDAFDQNFTVNELQWNRGASQQDEKELKEAYLELEMFDSRLWIRAGKQNIVWGKTELFRTTDQFNPQDLALASLPNLEESRIALWAIRAIWSFYEVGPFEDVRFEVAANFDQFEPNDLGRCGEPYTPLVACTKTFGLLNHGQNQIGLAGEIRPPNPWNSWKGIEVGARLEWRWDRFSFAITDFYGYSDLPYADLIFTYYRNVDPETGRPRRANETGSCRTGREDACLTPDNALTQHQHNQTAFAWVCAGTVGVSSLDSGACAQSVFNSQVVPTTGSPAHLAALFGIIMSGQNAALAVNGNAIFSGLAFGVSGGDANNMFLDEYFAAVAEYAPFAQTYINVTPPPILDQPIMLVPLVADPMDGAAITYADLPAAVQATLAANGAIAPATTTGFLANGLSPFLTDEQEALLGCGPFYQTNCDLDGIDFLNADSNALYESWPQTGTFRDGQIWRTTDSAAQPGTLYFDGYTCANLPGCRGPRDDGYDINVDGSTADQVHPITGQPWRSEISILSWNFLMMAVGLSAGEAGIPDGGGDPAGVVVTKQDAADRAVFDPRNPFARDRCSFREPIWCSFVRGLLGLTGVTRRTVKAGGNGRYGRRNFLWQGGSDLVLRYEKRNVFGMSMDFAEDVTKTNWSFEFTWIEGVPAADSDAWDGNSEIDTFNLTVSVDRPTFINFLNANRTFFFNSQWFFQYREDHLQSHQATGPWNVFFTFAVNTGYFQDRLLPGMVFVYDIKSNSGAVLPQITYRFTENFSASFGLGIFAGRWKEYDAPINDPAAGAANRIGRNSQKTFGEPGLSAVRERDEIFMRLRYTF